MATQFYGKDYHEHHEKEVKNFTAQDYAVIIMFFGIAIAATVLGFMGRWGFMIMLVGVDLLMFEAITRVILETSSKILIPFDYVGIVLVFGGAILESGHKNWLIPYLVIAYSLMCFGIGFFCYDLGKKTRKKLTRILL